MKNIPRTFVRARYLFVAAFLIIGGCMVTPFGPQFGTSMPAISEAQKFDWDTDFKKYSSGLYTESYVGKFFVVDGYYREMPLIATAYTQGRNWIDVIIVPPIGGTREEMMMQASNPRFISGTAPLSMRDQIIGLKQDQPIRVYGTVQQFGGTGLGRVFNSYTISSSLALVVQKIEAR